MIQFKDQDNYKTNHDSIQEQTKEPIKFIFSVRTEDFEIIIKKAFE